MPPKEKKLKKFSPPKSIGLVTVVGTVENSLDLVGHHDALSDVALEVGLVANTNNVTDATLATLTGGAYDTTNNVYTWNGPASGFAKMSPSEFETALKSVTVNNGNTVINGELGTAFYNWLSEIGAIGKDALGNNRGAAWWPGAYQN